MHAFESKKYNLKLNPIPDGQEYRRKRPICENALIENARFSYFSQVYFFFFSSSFLFFSFLVLFFLVIYVHSRVSSSVVSGVHFFPFRELDLTAVDSLHSCVGTSYVTFKH